MPEMDGFDAVRRDPEREAGTGEHTPCRRPDSPRDAGRPGTVPPAGFDNYIAKPIRQSELQADTRRRRCPDHVAIDSVVDALREVSDGDDEFARELATSFLESAPRCLAGIDEALRSGDGIKLAAEAHGLKGISRTIGAGSSGLSVCRSSEAARRGELDAAAAQAVAHAAPSGTVYDSRLSNSLVL